MAMHPDFDLISYVINDAFYKLEKEELNIIVSLPVILDNMDNSFNIENIAKATNSSIYKKINGIFVLNNNDCLYRIFRTIFPYDDEKMMVTFTIEIVLDVLL